MAHADEITAALEEYRSLRTEIVDNNRLCLQCIGIVLGATGVMFGQGILSGNAWVFLLPIPILCAMYSYITDRRFTTWVIAGYIVVRLERWLPGLHWETALRSFRKTYAKRPLWLAWAQQVLVNEFVLFNMLVLLSGALFTIFIRPRVWGLLPLGAWGLFLIYSRALCCRLLREGQEGDAFVQKWLGILNRPSPADDSQ